MKTTKFKKPIIIAITTLSIFCFLFLNCQSSILLEQTGVLEVETIQKVKNSAILPDLAAVECFIKAIFNYITAS